MPKQKAKKILSLPLQSWKHGWELLIAMTERELKARYKLAILGFLWIILNPLLQMAVIGGVFSLIFKVPIADYFLFLFSGLLIWNYFSYTLTKVTPSMVYELSLIEKAKFPREVIPLAIILSNLVHTVISFILFAVLLLVLGKLHYWRIWLLPFPLLSTSLILIGLGLLSSALNVKFRDVNFFIQALVPLLFYGTPVLFSAALVPANLTFLLYLNPLSSSLELTRWILIGGAFPTWSLIVANNVVAVGIFLLGAFIFHQQAAFFDDWV
jgi:lipopolysaccharide transport system permease protein